MKLENGLLISDSHVLRIQNNCEDMKLAIAFMNNLSKFYQMKKCKHHILIEVTCN